MSVFGDIMSKIFSHSAKAQPAPSVQGGRAGSTPSGASAGSVAAAGAPQHQVDVEAVLTQMTHQKKEKLDWRRSIVDLMKLLNLDSSLSMRKELAKELHYGGNMNDSAAMNMWLHKEVMTKLAENGGKVPADLRR